MDRPGFDSSVMSPARRYDYWLGGKDNFVVDRAAGDAAAAAFPGVKITALQNRAFLQRAVRYAAHDLGIRQFLDIGTGLPTADNTHEVAQGVHPDARIVYVDNDPSVLAHARALLLGTAEGATAYIDADLRKPKLILADHTLSDTLDLSKPVALVLVAVLHFLRGDEAYQVVQTLLDRLVPGSCLVLSHGCLDGIDADQRAKLQDSKSVDDFTNRSEQEIARFFRGTRLVDPGLSVISRWRPEPGAELPPDSQVAAYGGVAIK
jgi:SAM-dependent methyltransferase